VSLFEGIISDLFPGVELPQPDYGVFLDAIKASIAKRRLQPVPWFIEKIIQVATRAPHTRGGRHLRSANRHLLAVPRFRLNTYGRKAFSVAGPMAWNSHPDFIRDPTSSTDCFRRLLKPYLCARYQCIQRIRGS